MYNRYFDSELIESVITILFIVVITILFIKFLNDAPERKCVEAHDEPQRRIICHGSSSFKTCREVTYYKTICTRYEEVKKNENN